MIKQPVDRGTWHTYCNSERSVQFLNPHGEDTERHGDITDNESETKGISDWASTELRWLG